MEKLKPFKLSPVFKDYIWGGERLKTIYNKQTDMSPVAESWELSCHKDGNSTVASGEYSGMTLCEYVSKFDKECMGEKYNGENFPILIKLIDAKSNLSVQVHPDDEYAFKAEGEQGKTEMWYIVDCDDDASLLYGFTSQISKDEFKRRIEDNTLLDVLNKVKVKKGDVFFIKSGTIHAIGAGCLIAEIQQNSNTTYRVYDYGRVDKDGNPRQLHIDKALDVTTLAPPDTIQSEGGIEQFATYSKKQLASCDYFTVYEYKLDGSMLFDHDGESFRCVLVTQGNLDIKTDNDVISLSAGQTAFIPASCLKCDFSGQATFLISYK